jgi:hypothetical protein
VIFSGIELYESVWVTLFFFLLIWIVILVISKKLEVRKYDHKRKTARRI